MRTEVLEITPRFAKELLDNGSVNFRRLRETVVMRYARDMEKGKWDLNGETIKLNKHLQVKDGQHRLHACIKAGKPFRTLVAYDIEEDLNIDAGTPRSLADYMSFDGKANAVALTSGLRFLHNFLTTGTFWSTRIKATNDQLLQLLADNPLIEESVTPGRAVHSIVGQSASMIALHYLFRQKTSKYHADSFFDQFKTGQTACEAIHSLRDKLYRNRVSKAKLTRNSIAALTIKTWNAFIQEKSVKRVYLMEGEDFPKILGLPKGRKKAQAAVGE